MRHDDARGLSWKGDGITNDVLKFRKVIEFESSCVVYLPKYGRWYFTTAFSIAYHAKKL